MRNNFVFNPGPESNNHDLNITSNPFARKNPNGSSGIHDFSLSMDKNIPRHFSSNVIRKDSSPLHHVSNIQPGQSAAVKKLFATNREPKYELKHVSPDFAFRETAPRARRRIQNEAEEKKFSEQLHKFPTLNINNFKPRLPANLNIKNGGNSFISPPKLNSFIISPSVIQPVSVANKIKSEVPSKQTTKKQKEILKSQLMMQLKKNNIFDVSEDHELTSQTLNQKNIPSPIKKQPISFIPQLSKQSELKNSLQSSMAFPFRRQAPQPQSSASIPPMKKSDFEIGKKLGKGQYGQVMVVRHKKTGFLCALKVMSKKVIKEQNYINQIVRQLSIQFYLSHPNIAPLYGYFYDEENIYLLVEYCEGGQLYNKIKTQRKMQQKQTSQIIKQVLDGLDYIHKLSIIHRDLKPENILFTYNTVKISDFGWAVFDSQGFRRTVSGSPLYYPPQIVKGEQYDQKIDLWNVGMMVYQCILGKIPFRIYSQLDLDKIVSDEITFPQYIDVSEVAKDFILKTMRKNAQQRMQIRQMFRHKFIKQFEEKQDRIPGLREQINRIL